MTQTLKNFFQDKKIFFVLFVVFLDYTSFNLIKPVIPEVFQAFHLPVYLLGLSYGLFFTFPAVALFLVSPLLGVLSDKYGRKPLFLLALFGKVIAMFAIAFSHNILWLLFGQFLGGLAGICVTIIAVYITDTSSPQHCAKYFSYLGVSSCAGVIMGPFLGILLKSYDFHVHVICALFVSLLNLVYGYFIFPESLKKEDRLTQVNLEKLNPFIVFTLFFKQKKILVLILIFFLYQFISNSHNVAWNLFTEEKFHWTNIEVNESNIFAAFCSLLAQLILVNILLSYLSVQKSILVCFLSLSIGSLLYVLTPYSWTLFPITVLIMPSYIIGNMMRSFISGEVGASIRGGELQGILSSINSLAGITAPCLSGILFGHFGVPQAGAFYMPGIVDLFCAVLGVVALSLFALKKGGQNVS